jgi:hypothetical protein
MADLRTEYFATLPVKDLCPELTNRVDSYYNFLRSSGRWAIWRRSYNYYYAGLLRGGQLNSAGAEGEYTTTNINHYRNLLQHLKNMTTQQLPALNPRAANTDYKSMAQTIIASGILDYYLNEKQMAEFADLCTELSLVFGEGEVSVEWDTGEGDDYGVDPNTQRVVKTGDAVISTLSPVDVVKDIYQPDSTKHAWKITRHFKNKFDLAAKYPAAANNIIAASINDREMRFQRFGYSTMKDSELIPVFRFYHKKTESMPNGRFVEFIDSQTWLADGPLQYGDIPLYRMAPAEEIGTPFGYTIGFDLLPVQQAIDGLYSTVITNQKNYGVQNIAVPTGANVGVQQVAGGLNIITYDPKAGKPEGLNLTNTPPEIFKFIEMLEHVQEILSGVNSVARGNPEANLKSGAALALVQSMAIQFNSGLQKSYARLWSDMGTALIDRLKTFPQSERNIVIAGKNNRSYMAAFTKDKLSQINRVTVDLGNPLSRTTAGKVDMADNLLQRGLIKEPEQYIEVLTTGKLEPTYEGPQAEKMLIRAENEKLMEGKPVRAIATDQHKLHLQEHKTVIASPESRENPEVVKNTLAHMQEHIQLLRTTDPALLAAVGEQSIAPAPVPGVLPAPAAGMPPSAGKPTGSPGATMAPGAPVQQAAEKVNQPGMPKNPLTGDKFDPVSGGL